MIPRSPKPGVSSTWVNSQWKFLPHPGHFSVEINILMAGRLRKVLTLRLKADRLALGTAIVFAAYALVRAASFHPVDALIHLQIGPLSPNRLLEFAVNLFIAALAIKEIVLPSARRQ